jgi:hypothetical protein
MAGGKHTFKWYQSVGLAFLSTIPPDFNFVQRTMGLSSAKNDFDQLKTLHVS